MREEKPERPFPELGDRFVSPLPYALHHSAWPPATTPSSTGIAPGEASQFFILRTRQSSWQRGQRATDSPGLTRKA